MQQSTEIHKLVRDLNNIPPGYAVGRRFRIDEDARTDARQAAAFYLHERYKDFDRSVLNNKTID